MLPPRYGGLFVGHRLEVLGEEILPCLNFVTKHIVLDVGHTDFNARTGASLKHLPSGCVFAVERLSPDDPFDLKARLIEGPEVAASRT